MGMKEEQLEEVVAFLSGSDDFFLLDLGRVSAMHACLLPFAFELLGETDSIDCHYGDVFNLH